MVLKYTKKISFHWEVFAFFKHFIVIPSSFWNEVNPDAVYAGRGEKPGMFIAAGRKVGLKLIQVL